MPKLELVAIVGYVVPMGISPEQLISFYYQAGASTFTHIQSFDGYDVVSSSLVEGHHTNHILYRRGEPRQILQEADEHFSRAKEIPTFYHSPLAETPDLFDESWRIVGRDVWMSRVVEKIQQPFKAPSGLSVEVVDPSAPEEYLQTFIEAFSDPDDVYGVISEGYVTSERNSFDLPELAHLVLLCRQDGKAVGAVHAFIKDDLAYLCAFGVIKAYRKGGHVALALGYRLLGELYGQGVRTAFLVTEKGSVLERFYRHHGFVTLFEGRYLQLA